MVKILRENNELKQITSECIKGATLLSIEETERLLTQEERKCTYEGKSCWWWLRSPGNYQHSAAYVRGDGSVRYIGDNVSYVFNCVRPALILNLKSSNLQSGDVFEFGEHRFKIISMKYALCEEAIGQCAFREDDESKDANVYEKSDVKKYVDDWFNKGIQDLKDNERGIRTVEQEGDLYAFGF